MGQPIKMAGDNIDKRVQERDQRSTNLNKDLHWFVTLAFKERLSFLHLPDDRPIADLSNLPLTEFLVSVKENAILRRNLSVLLLRIICPKLSFLKSYERFVPVHIPHKYSEHMAKKSEYVNLGIIPENSNTSEGIDKT